MKKVVVTSLAVLLTTLSHAQGKDAEALVAGKQKADMTYLQLMEIMGEASSMMHKGVLRQNKQMVKEGADIILTHPAPNHKPWTIMAEEDQAGFKKSLLAYDQLLDTKAGKVVEDADQGAWTKASNSLNDLNATCLSCHAMWQEKVKR
ncbi:hypothetical protein [Thiohalomonas denitrificans]|uniref:Cytochrome C n=1 Tax=Thiohalomonas denitrificans TaxID=415747 RepID=A0A1G5R1K7_9GAMM|nr:hypothetical protein [Thiohalomonas denitrificans]SCZ67877.1 hypothetical protein SAMN03097708_03220 [Thiohalomonas denitrificans]